MELRLVHRSQRRPVSRRDRGLSLPGWYEMTFEQPTNPIISFNTRRKYLDAEDPALPINKAGLVAGAKHPFDQLFLMQAP